MEVDEACVSDVLAIAEVEEVEVLQAGNESDVGVVDGVGALGELERLQISVLPKHELAGRAVETSATRKVDFAQLGESREDIAERGVLDLGHAAEGELLQVGCE